MVVFTCQKCNSTLKKNVVEKHNCCRPFFLTCIDCLKDFRGKEYVDHKSCITEAQKYGGANVTVKQQGVKQEKWMDTVKDVLMSLSRTDKYRNICHALKASTNTPRHRLKFHNFVRSACPRLYDSKIIDEIFDHFEEARNNKSDPAEKNESKTSKNGLTKSVNIVKDEDVDKLLTNDVKVKKKKKHKESIHTAQLDEVFNVDDSLSNEFGNKKKKDMEVPDIDLNDCLSTEINNKKKKTEKNTNGIIPNDEDKKIDVTKSKSKKDKKNSVDLNGTKNLIFQTSANEEEIIEVNKNRIDHINGGSNQQILESEKKKDMKKIKKKILQSLSHEQKNNICQWFNIEKKEISEQPFTKDELNNNIDQNEESKSNNDDNKLSKKERKKLKKKQKFLADIADIEKVQPEKVSDGDFNEEKMKKRKKKNVEAKTEEFIFSSLKHKLDEDNVTDDIVGKRIKLNETLQEDEITSNVKFDWSAKIKEILRINTNDEVSLKKLRKKVINEYVAQKGNDVPYETLLGIFNKKVNKTLGVKVLKDKARLIN